MHMWSWPSEVECVGCEGQPSVSATYLDERLDAWLEDHVGVEEEGADERLRVAGQLEDHARQQDVHIQRVLQHVLQLGKQHHNKRPCNGERERERERERQTDRKKVKERM